MTRRGPIFAAAAALLLGLSACASRRTMKEQSVIIAASAEELDGELAELDRALDTVHRLRRVRIEGDRLAADRAARETANVVGGWRLDDDPVARAKLATFEGVREASSLAGGHGYGVVDYKLGVGRSLPGYGLDRQALRRLVSLLLRLARPGRFKDEAAFFVGYAVAVGDGAKQGVDAVAKMAGEYAKEKGPPPEQAPPGDGPPDQAQPDPSAPAPDGDPERNEP